MAFVSSGSPDQDPNNPNQAGTQQSNQAPVTSAPNAGGTGKATTPSNQSTAQPFANLSSYLTANAPAVQNEAAGIAGNLTNTFNDTKGAIDTASQNFGNQVKSGYTQYDPNVLASFSADPTAVSKDPTAAASFRGMYGDRYTGPSTFEDTSDYTDLSGKVQKGKAFADQTASPAGIQSYFTAQSPTYTQGMGTLDSALLQANPDAVTTIQNAAAPMSTLPGYLTSAVTNNDAQAQQAVKDAATAKSAAGQAYDAVANPFAAKLNDTYQTTTQKSVDYNNNMNAIAAAMSNGDFSKLSPDQMKEIGFNPAFADVAAKYPSIFPTQAQDHPINFGSYFTQGDQAKMPTPSDVVTPDQIAEYQALAALSGQGPNLGFDMPTTSTADKFTQFGGALPSYDMGRATSAIEQAYGPMTQQLKDSGYSGVQPAEQKTIIDYMNSLRSTETGNTGPQPTTPPPAPGTGGDLGAGFHWDTSTGTWVPTIPLAPPGGPGGTVTLPGGGRATR